MVDSSPKNNKNRFYRVASIVKQGRVRNNNNNNNQGNEIIRKEFKEKRSD